MHTLSNINSDGVVEFLSNIDVVEVIHELEQQGLKPKQISRRLLELAQEKWQLSEQGTSDDVTIIVVYLQPHNCPALKRMSKSHALPSIHPAFCVMYMRKYTDHSLKLSTPFRNIFQATAVSLMPPSA